MVTTSGSGVMTTERPKNQKNMKRLLPNHGIENVGTHCSFPLFVMIFSRKPIMLHKHRIIAFITELPSAVVTRRHNDEKEAPRMDKADKTEQQKANSWRLKTEIIERRK